MKLKNILIKSNFILLCMIFALCATSCGSENSSSAVSVRTGSAVKQTDDAEDEADTDADTEQAESTEDVEYIIQSLDMTAETITAISVDGSSQVRYSYGLTTQFLDKYGNSYSCSHFTPGQVVIFGERNSSGVLTSVQMSADVWVYSGVIKYSIDEDRGVFTIASSNYRITENVLTFSGDESISLSDIGGGETLQVIGKDTDIVSVMVTTGCGSIVLTNTDLFDGSLIFIGNTVVTKVSEALEIEIQEGEYSVTVANNGFGGTAVYTVVANEITTIDLEDLKGVGTCFCCLTGETSVVGEKVYFDGSRIETGVEGEVAYGSHRLVVIADGYESWSKTLVVNSESATISLSLDEEEEEEEDEEEEDSDDEEEEETEEEEDSSTTSSTDAEVDYLTTLTSLISTLLDY